MQCSVLVFSRSGNIAWGKGWGVCVFKSKGAAFLVKVDVSTYPAPTQNLDLTQGRVGASPEAWIDPTFVGFHFEGLEGGRRSGQAVGRPHPIEAVPATVSIVT